MMTMMTVSVLEKQVTNGCIDRQTDRRTDRQQGRKIISYVLNCGISLDQQYPIFEI